MALLEGYGVGLALMALVGPVLLVLLRATLEHDRWHGLATAFGIFVSDILAVALCVAGSAAVLGDPAWRPLLALGGGLVLLVVGARTLLAPGRLGGPEDARPPGTRLLACFIAGFAVNFLNPAVFAIWIGIIGAASLRHGTGAQLVTFLAGTLLGLLTGDTLKVLLAARVRPLLEARVLKLVFRACGALLVLLGLRLLVLAVSSLSA